jgi:cyclopropane-fatty-acyl-phospholipid synthase
LVTGANYCLQEAIQFEHVGLQNLMQYFSKIDSLFVVDGIATNHGITSTDADSGETPYGNGEFIEKFVFPHGELPHLGLVLKTMQEAGLEAFDIENLRHHYARTCELWSNNFEEHAESIRLLAGERLYRIWRVYLAGYAYPFNEDWISLYQIVCVKAGSPSNTLPWSRQYMYSEPALPDAMSMAGLVESGSSVLTDIRKTAHANDIDT